MSEDPSPIALAGVAPWSRQLPGALLRAREAVMERLRPVLRAHDLTEQQWRVLRALSDGELEVSRLAQAAVLLAPSVSRIVRDLAARGLIARRGGPADQRVALVSITPDGRALVATVQPRAAAVGAEIALRFGAERLEALTTLLAELEAALGPQAGGL